MLKHVFYKMLLMFCIIFLLTDVLMLENILCLLGVYYFNLLDLAINMCPLSDNLCCPVRDSILNKLGKKWYLHIIKFLSGGLWFTLSL